MLYSISRVKSSLIKNTTDVGLTKVVDHLWQFNVRQKVLWYWSLVSAVKCSSRSRRRRRCCGVRLCGKKSLLEHVLGDELANAFLETKCKGLDETRRSL